MMKRDSGFRNVKFWVEHISGKKTTKDHLLLLNYYCKACAIASRVEFRNHNCLLLKNFFACINNSMTLEWSSCRKTNWFGQKWESLPWRQSFLQRDSFPRATVLHKPPQRGSLSGDAVLQELTAPAWIPHRQQILPEILLQRGLLSAGHSSHQELALAWSIHGLQGTATCSNVGSSMGCRWLSAPPRASMDCRGTACLTIVCSMGCRGISPPVPGAPPPLLHWTWCLQGCLSPFPAPFSQTPCSVFTLTTLSQRHHQLCWQAQLWPAAGPSWSQLELALCNTETAPADVFSLRPLLQVHPPELLNKFNQDLFKNLTSEITTTVPYRKTDSSVSCLFLRFLFLKKWFLCSWP